MVCDVGVLKAQLVSTFHLKVLACESLQEQLANRDLQITNLWRENKFKDEECRRLQEELIHKDLETHEMLWEERAQQQELQALLAEEQRRNEELRAEMMRCSEQNTAQLFAKDLELAEASNQKVFLEAQVAALTQRLDEAAKPRPQMFNMSNSDDEEDEVDISRNSDDQSQAKSNEISGGSQQEAHALDHMTSSIASKSEAAQLGANLSFAEQKVARLEQSLGKADLPDLPQFDQQASWKDIPLWQDAPAACRPPAPPTYPPNQKGQSFGPGSAMAKAEDQSRQQSGSFSWNPQAKSFTLNPGAAEFTPGGGEGKTSPLPSFSTYSKKPPGKSFTEITEIFFQKAKNASPDSVAPDWPEATGPSYKDVLGQPPQNQDQQQGGPNVGGQGGMPMQPTLMPQGFVVAGAPGPGQGNQPNQMQQYGNMYVVPMMLGQGDGGQGQMMQQNMYPWQ